MPEEFCEGNHCDQYIHSAAGLFVQGLMVPGELSRVGDCPFRYDKSAVKAIPEERSGSRSEVKGGPTTKKEFTIRSN